jgi:uncharacterized protein YacL
MLGLILELIIQLLLLFSYHLFLVAFYNNFFNIFINFTMMMKHVIQVFIRKIALMDYVFHVVMQAGINQNKKNAERNVK